MELVASVLGTERGQEHAVFSPGFFYATSRFSFGKKCAGCATFSIFLFFLLSHHLFNSSSCRGFICDLSEIPVASPSVSKTQGTGIFTEDSGQLHFHNQYYTISKN